MDRTLKIKGLGFSTTADDVEITVKIDGNIIFSGPVQTDKTTPYNPSVPVGTPISNLTPGTVAEWTENIEFAGTRTLEITASKGVFHHTLTTSSYMPVAPKTDPTAIFSSGENDVPCYALETETGIVRSPYTNVTINDVADECINAPGGLHVWGIEADKSLVATLNISAGLASPTLCDGTNILATTSATGDGANKDFAGSALNTDQTDQLNAYVDSVETALGQFNWTIDGTTRTIQFNTAPAVGAVVRIDSVQKWDPTWATYHGFYYN